MILLIFYLFLALFVSFLCSFLEAVLLSSNMSYLNVKKDEGHKSAEVFIRLKQNIEKPLSAILSLNTFAHTIGAAGVGAQATKLWGEAFFGIISAILTIIILVFSEIIPKTIGARYWRLFSMFSGRVINTLIYIMYPFVALSDVITRIISSENNEVTTSREELSALANIGVEEGIFKENENKLIQNILKNKSLKLYEIMTHRKDIAALPVESTFEEVVSFVKEEKYSRIPVYEENVDNIIGVMHTKYLMEYLNDCSLGEKFNLRDVIRKPFFAPEFKRTDELFKELQQSKTHLAIILDEYGGTAGLVTLEDILEEIVGNIFDEDDEEENDIVKLDDKTFIINGTVSLDDVTDYFDINLPTEEYETLSGFLIAQLGRIPGRGDRPKVLFEGIMFEVRDADEKIVSKVKMCLP